MRSPLVSFLLGKGDRSISVAPQVISYFGAYTRLKRACSRNGAVNGTRTRTDLLGRQVSYHWTTTAYEPTFTESETAPNKFVELACREQVPGIWYPQPELNRPRNT